MEIIRIIICNISVWLISLIILAMIRLFVITLILDKITDAIFEHNQASFKIWWDSLCEKSEKRLPFSKIFESGKNDLSYDCKKSIRYCFWHVWSFSYKDYFNDKDSYEKCKPYLIKKKEVK